MSLALSSRVSMASAKMVPTVCLAAVALGIAEGQSASAVSDDLVVAARALVAADAAFSQAKGADGWAPLKVGLARQIAFFEFQSAYELEFSNV